MLYQVNWYRLIQQLLPSFLRKPVQQLWLYALLGPLAELHAVFLAYRTDKLRELSYNGQTINMEAMLNYYWPSGGGGIFIENNPQQLPVVYTYYQVEQQPPLYIFANGEAAPPTYIYSDAEYLAGNVDFIIWVPVATVYTEAAMRARVDLYRAAGKRYRIQTY
jgi:hypothetical protein